MTSNRTLTFIRLTNAGESFSDWLLWDTVRYCYLCYAPFFTNLVFYLLLYISLHFCKNLFTDNCERNGVLKASPSISVCRICKAAQKNEKPF